MHTHKHIRKKKEETCQPSVKKEGRGGKSHEQKMKQDEEEKIAEITVPSTCEF